MRRARGRGRSRGSWRSTRGGTGLRLAALGLALALLGLAVTFYVRTRYPAPGRGGELPERIVLDSLKAADAREDWTSTLLWVERLGLLHPEDPAVLRSRGTAWSNFAVDQKPRRVVPRPARRTSLERAGLLQRAAALMDSSVRLAVEPAEWLESSERLAELYQNLGLPGDALAIYQAMRERAPESRRPAVRTYWLHALYLDPVHPDTSVYREQMARLGPR